MRKDQLKVHFASAAIYDEEQKALYMKVREILLDLRYSLSYDWLMEKEKLTPSELFSRTDLAIRDSDVVVAVATFPSTGVGQQITLAMMRKIPVIVLRSDSISPSKFTAGAQGDLMRYFEYNDANLRKILKDNLEKMKSEKFVKFNFISSVEINALLEKESRRMGQSRSQLLRQIIRNWLSDR